jgi:hypothetical protein
MLEIIIIIIIIVCLGRTYYLSIDRIYVKFVGHSPKISSRHDAFHCGHINNISYLICRNVDDAYLFKIRIPISNGPFSYRC